MYANTAASWSSAWRSTRGAMKGGRLRRDDPELAAEMR